VFNIQSGDDTANKHHAKIIWGDVKQYTPELGLWNDWGGSQHGTLLVAHVPHPSSPSTAALLLKLILVPPKYKQQSACMGGQLIEKLCNNKQTIP
jgi:hypothetical protein